MVGDAEDRKRYAEYRRLQDAAARLERDAEKAGSVREALRMRDRADECRRYAYRLFA